MSPRVAVVGGGIAGLTAAHALAGASHEVACFEQEETLGGKLRTTTFCDRPLDLGPDVFISRDPAAAELARATGLADALVAPSGSGAAIYARGRPRRLPSGLLLGVPSDLVALARSRILGPADLARAGLGLLRHGQPVPPAERLEEDPSVADALGQLGHAAIDSLIDPLLGGINAGDVRGLSLWSTAPALASMLADSRSLGEAIRRRRAAAPDTASGTQAPLFLGLAEGMGQLVSGVRERCEAMGVSFATGARIDSIEREQRTRWRLRGPAVDDTADAVVLAVPAFVAAELCRTVDPELAALCSEVEYADVVTVTLALLTEAVPARTTALLAAGEQLPTEPLPGTGMLIPRATGALCTAFTFVSTKWPRSAPPGTVVIRASAGRHGDRRAGALDDGALAVAVRRELEAFLGVAGEPSALAIQRWPRAFPQYAPGTRRRLARLRELQQHLGALRLCGAAFGGIGIPACVRSGATAAAELHLLLSGETATR